MKTSRFPIAPGLKVQLRQGLMCLIFIISLFLFTSIEATFRDLHQSTFWVLGNLSTFQANLRTPRAGEDILPPLIREAVALLES